MRGNFNKGDRVRLERAYASDKRLGLKEGLTGTVMDNHTTYPDVLFDGVDFVHVMAQGQLKLINK